MSSVCQHTKRYPLIVIINCYGSSGDLAPHHWQRDKKTFSFSSRSTLAGQSMSIKQMSQVNDLTGHNHCPFKWRTFHLSLSATTCSTAHCLLKLLFNSSITSYRLPPTPFRPTLIWLHRQWYNKRLEFCISRIFCPASPFRCRQAISLAVYVWLSIVVQLQPPTAAVTPIQCNKSNYNLVESLEVVSCVISFVSLTV